MDSTNSGISLDCPVEKCHLFGCSLHKLGFAISKSGKIFNHGEPKQIKWESLDEVIQIVTSCDKDSDTCRFYFRSITNLVHEWTIHTNEEGSRKRVKLNNSSAEKITPDNVNLIAKNIDYILPMDKPGVALFSGTKIQYFNAQSKTLENTTLYNPLDIKITCQQFTNLLDPCYKKFFSIPSLIYGLVYGTNEGSVYIRDLGADPIEDVKIMTFEGYEQVKFIDVITIPTLSKDHNTIIAFGDQGTIMVYSNASNNTNETNVSFNQFNVQGPLLSIAKASGRSAYLTVSALGHINHLDFKITTIQVELNSNMITPTYDNISKIHVFDSESHTFDAICDHDGTACYKPQCKYNLVSPSDDPEEIKRAIEQALAQLKLSEAEVKKLDESEQALNKKLASVNKTLYALRSINNKRKLGVANSLESTGFEFSIRPIIKVQSIANSSLHCPSFLRICIKTSRFLELEDWDLQLDFFPERLSTLTSSLGQTKSVSVMGFEPHFENGIERYSIWERDIEIDLDKISLPVKVSATLVMSINEPGASPLLFPVTDIVIDDLHFAVPCTPDFILGMERRGLEDVSHRLMESFNRQKLHDKTGKYPFARLINSKMMTNDVIPSAKLFDYREIHIRCAVDMHMTNDCYRSILSRILNEGRTMEDMKKMLTSAEQAIFTLASFPGCPVIVKLSRVSSTLIDICVQCVYLPVLFKVEATLLARLYQDIVKQPVSNKQGQDSALQKRLRSLEEAVFDIQDKYQYSKDQMDIDGSKTISEQLKSAIDVLYSIHHEKPIGHLHIDLSGNE